MTFKWLVCASNMRPHILFVLFDANMWPPVWKVRPRVWKIRSHILWIFCDLHMRLSLNWSLNCKFFSKCLNQLWYREVLSVTKTRGETNKHKRPLCCIQKSWGLKVNHEHIEVMLLMRKGRFNLSKPLINLRSG